VGAVEAFATQKQPGFLRFATPIHLAPSQFGEYLRFRGDCLANVGRKGANIREAKLVTEHIPQAIQIVDIFHAKQHLFDIAKAIFGAGTDLAEQWGSLRRDELDVAGVLEGACKSVIAARLKRGGMHWTRHGANAAITLGCTLQSNRFDDFWGRHAHSAYRSSHKFVVHPHVGVPT